MELFAILCIDKTHYISYVKTGEVSHKWVYFDSMASSGNSIFQNNLIVSFSNCLHVTSCIRSLSMKRYFVLLQH